MCRFLSLDFEYTLKCPVDKQNHSVRFQAFPQLRGHALDVVECDAKPTVDQLTCSKACLGCLSPASTGKRSIRSQRLTRTVSERLAVNGGNELLRSKLRGIKKG
jgi:Fe-S cluster biogenesis protein NfuA